MSFRIDATLIGVTTHAAFALAPLIEAAHASMSAEDVLLVPLAAVDSDRDVASGQAWAQFEATLGEGGRVELWIELPGAHEVLSVSVEPPLDGAEEPVIEDLAHGLLVFVGGRAHAAREIALGITWQGGGSRAARVLLSCSSPGHAELEVAARIDGLLATARVAAQAGDVARSAAELAAVLALARGFDGSPRSQPVCSRLLQATEFARSIGDAGFCAEAGAICLSYMEAARPRASFDRLLLRSRHAEALAVTGRFAEGIALGNALVADLRELLPPRAPRTSLLLQTHARVLAQAGRLEEARPLQIEALAAQLAAPEPDPLALAFARMNLSSTLATQGDLIDALPLIEQAQAEFERRLPAGHDYRIHALINLGATLDALGDAAGARAYLERALAELVPGSPSYPPFLGQIETNLGSVLLKERRDDEAIALAHGVYERRSRELPPDHPDLLLSRSNLMACLLSGAQGDPTRAEGLLSLAEEALIHLPVATPEDSPERLTLLANRANALYLVGDTEEALEALRDALRRMEASASIDSGSIAEAATMLAWWCLEQGLPEEAEAELLGFLERLRTELERSCLMLSPSGMERWILAQEPVVERTFAIQRRLPGSQTLREACFSLGESLRAARLFAANAQRELARADPSARERLFAAAHELAALQRIGAPTNDVATVAHALDRLQREVLVAVRAGGADGLARGAWIRPAEVAQGLGEDEAVLCLRSTVDQDPGAEGAGRRRETLVAFTLCGGGELVRIDIDPLAPALESLARWRAALGLDGDRLPAGRAEQRAAGEDLRIALFDPLLDHLPARIRTLHVVADGLVAAVPLDALPIGSLGGSLERDVVEAGFAEGLEPDDVEPHHTVVGDALSVRMHVSVRELSKPRSMPAEDAEPALLVAMGGVAYDTHVTGDPLAGAPASFLRGRGPRFAPLRHSAEEVSALAAHFRTRYGEESALVLIGEEADRANLERLAPRATYLHLATHAVFAADQAASALAVGPLLPCMLALAGANAEPDDFGRVPGILTGEEVAALDLARCELVVLSACESSLGAPIRGQGLASLQLAFQIAGARNALGARWPVEDAPTAELMGEFYRALLEDRRDPQDALWSAKLTLRARGLPLRDWAAWTLTGPAD